MRKTNRVRSKKLDKDRIFTSRRNPRSVFEAIYSFKFDSSSNPNAVLRSTHDPTNSPNAASRSMHDLRQTSTNALGIDTRSHDDPGMLRYHLLHAGQQPTRNPPMRDRCSQRCTHTTKQRNNRESKPTQYLTRFDNLPTSSGQGRERDFIDSTINTSKYQRDTFGDF